MEESRSTRAARFLAIPESGPSGIALRFHGKMEKDLMRRPLKFLAWAMWRATYLIKMPGMAQKARILSDWLLDMIFGRDPIIIGPHTPALERKNEIQ